jgi:hypothetical protein
VAVTLTSPVLGQAPGYVYTGPLEAWLEAQGYAKRNSGVVDHQKTTAVLPKDDPTLAINREAPNTAGAAATPKLSGGLAAPEVSTVVRSGGAAQGAVGGGTIVTISGDNLSDVTGVTFDGTPGTALEIVDDQTIKVTTPAHAAGAVNVVVTDPDGSATKTNGYTYA